MHKSVAKDGDIICWHTASGYIALKKILHLYLAKNGRETNAPRASLPSNCRTTCLVNKPIQILLGQVELISHI